MKTSDELFGMLVIISSTLLVTVSTQVGASEPVSNDARSDSTATSDYLFEEQRQREQQQMENHREAQREQFDARQRDLQDRVQQRRDEMMRGLNSSP